jgi:hypothetical protein
MNRNANGKQKLCIIISRRSSIVIAFTLLHSFLRNIPELASVAAVLGLPMCLIYTLYLDMAQLHDKILSIEEKARAFDQRLQWTMSGGGANVTIARKRQDR